MIQFNKENLLIEAKLNFTNFMKKEKKSLITYTNDSKLQYIADDNIEKFKLDFKNRILYIPLSRFLDDYNEEQILFYIYYELALYNDWKINSNYYINRYENFKLEIDGIITFILSNISKENDIFKLNKNIIYNIKKYIVDILKQFLFEIDKYYAYLRLMQLCPNFRDKDLNKLYMKNLGIKRIYTSENFEYAKFAKSFLIIDLYSDDKLLSDTLGQIFNKDIFNKSLFDFVRSEFISQINQSRGIIERDRFVRMFLYDKFEKLWKHEFNEFNFKYDEKLKDGKTKKENISELSSDKNNMDLDIDDIDNILKDMKSFDEQMKLENKVEDKFEKLLKIGLNKTDYDVFNYYALKMQKERKDMFEIWKKIIGDIKKDENIKKVDEVRGKLYVPSLINNYPNFIESQKTGNYKNLPIFSKYILKTNEKRLPEKIEISFVIDNSGSMGEEKIEATRKALAVILLSVDDLNIYLKKNNNKLNSKIEAVTETWFFGSEFRKVKKFYYQNELEKQRDIIKSISAIDGTSGATDDARVFKAIAENIDYKKEIKLKNKKEVKILFEITDGASSFPGLAKLELEKLQNKFVEVFGIQIGKTTEKEREIFNFIWNDEDVNNGLILGEDIVSLPNELLKVLASKIDSAFK